MERPQPIKNPALMEAIAQAKKDPGVENTVKLLNEVVSAKLLIPEKKKQLLRSNM